MISKKHGNSMSTQEHLFIDSKQSPQEFENQRSIISLQTGIPRDTKFQVKETEMNSQIVFRSWWYEHQESHGQNHYYEQKQLSTKNIESYQRGWDRLVLTRGDTQLFMREKHWYDLFTKIDSSLQGYAHWTTIGRINNQCQNISWGSLGV